MCLPEDAADVDGVEHAPRSLHGSEKGKCFDVATALCRGPWHQVAEPGMAFPAIVNDEQGAYRMLVACDE